MSTGVRAGTHVIAADLESTAFNTQEADFDTEKLRFAAWDVSPGFKEAVIENSAVRVDLGEHPPGVGLQHQDSELGFTTYTQGLGTAAGDAVAATATAFSHLLAGCLGGSEALSTGSTASGTPTAIEVIETDDGNHADDTLVGFAGASGAVYVRPVGTYTTDTTTGVMDLLMALPSGDLPTASDVIYGGVNVQSAESSLQLIQGEVVGKNTAQTTDFLGAIGNFSIPEAGEGDAQTINFTFKPASFDRYQSTTQVAPAVARPLVNAGGEFLLGKFGNTAGLSLRFLRIGIELARTFVADPDASADSGLCGWVLTDQQTRITVHVPDAQSMPTGFTVTNFHDSFTSSDLTENDYHLLCNWGGRTAGKIFSLYFPRMHLVMPPEQVDIDGIAAQKLTFGLTQGQYDSATGQDSTSGVAKIWAAQH